MNHPPGKTKPSRCQPKYRSALIPCLLGLGSAIFSAKLPAYAQSEAEQLREELRQLKRDYQSRIEVLEERLKRLETKDGAADTNRVPVPALSSVAMGHTNAPGSTANTNAAWAAREFAKTQFQQDTESREYAWWSTEHPFRERMEQVLQDFIEIHGYFRAGYGRDSEGGPQVAFQAPGALAKYRLGNEAENYGELTFAKDFYVPKVFGLDPKERPDGTPSGPIARVQTTMSIYNPYQDLLSSQATTFGLPEVYGSIGNVLASEPSMKFWAGSRYYRRHDIHINDFYFYNMSGTGGGMEDLELPFGKVALAWIGAASSSGFSDLPQPDANNKAGFSKANWDLRLYDVPLPLGKGEFGVVYAREDSGMDSQGRSAPGTEGAAVTALHTMEHFISDDGINKLSLQFGTGPAKTFTSGFEMFSLTNGVYIRPDARNSWRFRVTESFTANLNEHFSLGPALVYQLTDLTDQGGMTQWASAGVRPILHFNKYLSLALEPGVDWVKDRDSGTSDYMFKVTLAPQVSIGNRFMSRPVIRTFVTYAHWGDSFRGQIGGNDFLGETQGLTYGVQMEAWW